MANYKVYVVNQIKLGTTITDPQNSAYFYKWDQATLDKTVAELKILFDDVCKTAGSKFQATDVLEKPLATAAGSVKTTELVVRLTRMTAADSAVIKKFGNPGGNGATVDTGTGVISEAWLESAAGGANQGELMARLAFHELMHNKLDTATNAPLSDIHTTPDDGTGLAVGTAIVYNTAISSKNKTNMAPNLGSVVQQFTGTTIP